MGFKELYLYNFRNYEILKVNIEYPEVYFVGDNGQGKTNLLEALYYLCYGASFRTKHEKNIVRHNENQMAASSTFYDEKNYLNKISIQNDNNSKKIILNNRNIIDRKEIISNLPCVVFCHSDLEFVIGNPEKKRQFYDQVLSIIHKDYLITLRNYKKVLKSKNLLLKKNPDKKLLSVYNSQLVETGLNIQNMRKSIVEEFNTIIKSLFFSVSDLKGELTIEYNCSWKSGIKDEIIDYLNSKIEYEIKMKSASYGPHRDNFKYKFNGMEFIDIASTGQLRLLSLILRASQGIFYKKFINRKPILLLDDVLLELDPEKRESFMKILPEYEQAFFTFLPDSTLIHSGKGVIMKVEKGKII